MKNIYIKLLLILVVGLPTASCDDQLDLQPPAAISDELALLNDKNVKLSLVGGYNALSSVNLFGGYIMRNSELMASNGEIVFSGTFNDPADMWRKSLTTTNGEVSANWIAAYNTINIANNVMSALDVVNEEDVEQVEGEALFLRGLSYFELVKFFGQPYSAGNTTTNLAVPLVLTPTRGIDETSLVARATVEEVYNHVLSDLISAEAKLVEGPEPGRATKEAAAAILSRVYLQMGDYTNARDAAHRVIQYAEAGNYELNSAYADAFNTGTTAEDIFDVPVSTQDGVNGLQTFYGSTAFSGARGDIEIQSAHLALYEAGDERLLFHYADPVTGETRSGKWMDQYGNVKVVRLAEMYLTRAETNQRLGTTVGAAPVDDVNVIRSRANLPDLGAVTLADILRERELELAHEGQKLHDFKRTQRSVAEGAITYTYDHDLLVFPIPQRDRNVNPNLSQNDGY